jgi:5-formyltetrahydrofolate cyclo-ligase
MQALRQGVSQEDARRAGCAVARRLLDLPEIERIARVALYASLRDELPTRPIFDELHGRGLPTLFPRSLPDGLLGFVAVERWEDLVAGRYGVPEPEGPGLLLGVDDLVVVPGLAFDGAGRRLGRGAGWYDRTFPVGMQGAPLLVGVGFAFQRVDLVPAGATDRGMDVVVTDREAWRAPPGSLARPARRWART